MPSEPGFNLSPERVKAGDEIKVTGNIGAVSTIMIGTFQLPTAQVPAPPPR